MKWWKKAIIGTIILLAVVAGLAFILHQQNVKTSSDAQSVEFRDDKLSTLCGEISGAGIIIIWVFAYRGNKPSVK